jgi:hypothetical protein
MKKRREKFQPQEDLPKPQQDFYKRTLGEADACTTHPGGTLENLYKAMWYILKAIELTKK